MGETKLPLRRDILSWTQTLCPILAQYIQVWILLDGDNRLDTNAGLLVRKGIEVI